MALLKVSIWKRQSQVHLGSHTCSSLLCSLNSIFSKIHTSETEPAPYPKDSWYFQKQDMIGKDTYWLLDTTTGPNSQKVTIAIIRKVTNNPEVVSFGNEGDSSGARNMIIQFN